MSQSSFCRHSIFIHVVFFSLLYVRYQANLLACFCANGKYFTFRLTRFFSTFNSHLSYSCKRFSPFNTILNLRCLNLTISLPNEYAMWAQIYVKKKPNKNGYWAITSGNGLQSSYPLRLMILSGNTISKNTFDISFK